MVDSLRDSPSAIPLPDPLVEEPPNDRWCDIIMKGGVASGVVYPWAILELARKYRLRNLGGTSVGAMAASIAAACEYGRRQGNPNSYEVMRRLPSELGKDDGSGDNFPKKTVMLSLFQPAEPAQKLFNLIVDILNDHYKNNQPSGKKKFGLWGIALKHILRNIGPIWPLTLFISLSVMLVQIAILRYGYDGTALEFISYQSVSGKDLLSLGIWIVASYLIVLVVKFLYWIVVDLKKDILNGMIKNDLGLCRGSSQYSREGEPVPALIEWMHEAVQRGAGLRIDGTPLTFEDLWRAPLWPGGASPVLDKNGVPTERSINLEMITTNVTHGRPYRLPLLKSDPRLFFDVKMWEKFFPAEVMNWLVKVSEPYKPISPQDPSASSADQNLRELPTGKLPILVAARLSLSYPLLFSTVPVYAIDYDETKDERIIRLCRFSDGGLCSNFPIHFFDSALPRWPTFGLSLDDRKPEDKVAVRLPMHQDDGKFDGWYPIELNDGTYSAQASELNDQRMQPEKFRVLSRFLWSAYLTSKDWRDRTAIKMPHVRRRVVRLGLRAALGEGQLNIGMSEEKILNMAKIYGTASGKLLCDAYAPEDGSNEPTDAWREHLWVRLHVLLEGVGDLLDRFGVASATEGHTVDTNQILQKATIEPAIKNAIDNRVISDSQRDELRALVSRIVDLESALSSRGEVPHKPEPLPELRLRPPL